MSFISGNTLLFSLLGGILPALLWLFFWIREDAKHPEPRSLIMLAFIGGMIAVPLAIPLQQWTLNENSLLLTFIFWSTIEEFLKFGAAYILVLRRKEDDEPIDPLIYMMTAALGFVALENTLFILKPLLDGNIVDSLITGNVRFVGASLLHTISSAAIGIGLGLSFYRSRYTKQFAFGISMLIAIALHTAFNFFIIKETASITLATLGFVWIAIVILMLFFEKIKKVHPTNTI
jgi:RsiW-degrading membrane proteinase PrsW (M82 family)